MTDNLVKVKCDHCGNDTFAIYYDEQAQGYHTECDDCGTVFLHG